MYQRVLCPTDSSGFADRAAVHALSIARRFDATLDLVYVIDTSLIDVRGLQPDFQDAMAEPGNRSMDAIEAVADDLGLRTGRTVMQGRPADGILKFVEDNESDLIVLGRRGATGLEKLLLGSVSDAVVGRSSVPVITSTGEQTLSEGAVKRCRYDRILLATDGSTGVTAATDNAIALADAYDADLHVIYVIDDRHASVGTRSGGGPTIEAELRERGHEATTEIAARAEAAGVPVTEVIERGVPSQTITRYADSAEIDLIAIGASGRGGFRQKVTGSVADRVVRLSSVPVLTARTSGE